MLWADDSVVHSADSEIDELIHAQCSTGQRYMPQAQTAEEVSCNSHRCPCTWHTSVLFVVHNAHVELSKKKNVIINRKKEPVDDSLSFNEYTQRTVGYVGVEYDD